MDEKVISTITKELQRIIPDKPVEEMLDLYIAFSRMETPVERGIRSDWLDNVTAFYQMSDSMRASHEALLNAESFLKKVLYVIDEPTYARHFSENSLTMRSTMEQIGLLKDFPQNTRLDSYRYAADSNPIRSAIAQTYQLRNNQAHTSEDWSPSQMFTNVNAVMIATLYAVWLNRKVLETRVNVAAGNNQYGIDTLLKAQVKEYDRKIGEGFRYVSLLWEDNTRSQSRQILLDDLLADKQVLLSGDAGCGKTTALDQLEYQAAKKYLEAQTSVIPVKLALINENPSNQLEEMICHKLNIPSDYCQSLLEDNRILLLVDGLNELTTDAELKSRFVTALECFIAAHPRTGVVVTDRRYSPFPIQVQKTYQLKPLDKSDIVRYAKSRPECNDTVLTLLNELLEKPAFAELEFTPLLINQLLLALSAHQQLPNDLSDLIGIYLETLQTREYYEKRDLNAAPGKLDLFLMKLAMEMELGGSFRHTKALKLCADVMQAYGLQVDSYACVNLAVQLGILQLSDNSLSFLLNEYHTYYLLRAIEEDL